MKILQLVTRRQHRGAEISAALVSQELHRMGHAVIFAGLYAPPVHSLTVEGAFHADVSARQSFFSISGFRRLLALVDRERPDVLHANGSDTLKYLVAIKAIRPGMILGYRNISVISHWLGHNLLKRSFYGILFRQVNFITSVGEVSRNDFVKCFPFLSDRTHVVRRGIAFPGLAAIDHTAIRNRLGIPSDKQVVLHVGNFSSEKNHNVLLESFALVASVAPAAILVLVGEGAGQNQVREKAASLGVSDRVRFEGLQRDIGSYFAISSLTVLTSSVEGVPGVLLEAAAYKVPAVAINVGGVAEAVLDNVTGILVNDFSPETFSTAVLNLLNNHALRTQLGKEAERYVKEKFGIKRCAAEFVAIFDDALRIKKDVR